jgi:hypothetical protein
MIVKNNKYQKEWHNATKPLYVSWGGGAGCFFVILMGCYLV